MMDTLVGTKAVMKGEDKSGTDVIIVSTPYCLTVGVHPGAFVVVCFEDGQLKDNVPVNSLIISGIHT